MSKSVKIAHYKRKVPHTELIHLISQDLCISEQTAAKVLERTIFHVTDQLLQGNAVHFRNLCTFHLRRRDFDETRRANFRIGGGAGTLPLFCYYAYAEISTNLKKEIAAHKDQLATLIGE